MLIWGENVENIWEPAFCSEYKAVIETDHLSGEPREKRESEFFIKYRKNVFSIFDVYPSKIDRM